MQYKKRTGDEQLRERLYAFGAVLIEGPKWCGKTTTAEQMAKYSHYNFYSPYLPITRRRVAKAALRCIYPLGLIVRCR